MRVTFDQSSVRDYEFVHGTRPRGVGNWSFQLHRSGSSTEQSFTGKFTEAKTQAMRLARELGCSDVRVNT